MPPKTTVASSQIKTRAKNKDTHPGIPDRAPPRRTSVEVESERAAKAQATAARQEKKRQNIRRTAEFETADMANEDFVDATPRPCFTPKPRQPARSRKNASLGPVAEVSDGSGDGSTLLFQPLDSEGSVTGEESADDSDPRPLAKKLKAHTTGKAIPKVGRASPPQKKSRKATPRAEEIVLTPNEVDEKTAGKAKKVKLKVREQIDMQVKEIEEETNRDMARLTSSRPAGDVTPPLSPSEVQESGFQWGGALKRMGAIADLKAYACTTGRNQQSQQSESEEALSTKRVQPNNNNPIRQVSHNIFSLIPHVRVTADTRSIHPFLSGPQRFLYWQ